MKRRPFSPEELEIISGLALQGFPASKIAVHLATAGIERSAASINHCRGYTVNRRDYLDNAPAPTPEPVSVAPSVFPKFTWMVTPEERPGSKSSDEIVKVPVSVRAMSWYPSA